MLITIKTPAKKWSDGFWKRRFEYKQTVCNLFSLWMHTLLLFYFCYLLIMYLKGDGQGGHNGRGIHQPACSTSLLEAVFLSLALIWRENSTNCRMSTSVPNTSNSHTRKRYVGSWKSIIIVSQLWVVFLTHLCGGNLATVKGALGCYSGHYECARIIRSIFSLSFFFLLFLSFFFFFFSARRFCA